VRAFRPGETRCLPWVDRVHCNPPSLSASAIERDSGIVPLAAIAD
jgi:hypothetical protein